LSADKIKEYVTELLLLLVFSFLSVIPIPALSILASAVSVAILGYITTRHHYALVVFAIFCQIIVPVLLLGHLFFITAIPMMLCGLTLGIGYNVRLSPVKIVAVCSAVCALNLIAGLKFVADFSDENLLMTIMESAKSAYLNLFTESFGSSVNQEEISAYISQMITTLVQFTPALIVIACFLFALLVYYLFKRICTIRKTNISELTPFSEWRAEKSVAIIYFAALVISFLFSEQNLATDVVLNIIMIMTFVFFVYGIALIEYILKKRIHKSWIRKCILLFVSIFALLTAGIFFFAMSIAGALDAFVDYRHRKISHR